jgi:hypothetical protein
MFGFGRKKAPVPVEPVEPVEPEGGPMITLTGCAYPEDEWGRTRLTGLRLTVTLALETVRALDALPGEQDLRVFYEGTTDENSYFYSSMENITDGWRTHAWVRLYVPDNIREEVLQGNLDKITVTCQ